MYARRHAGDGRFCFGTGKVNALAGFTGAVLLAGFALLMAVESSSASRTRCDRVRLGDRRRRRGPGRERGQRAVLGGGPSTRTTDHDHARPRHHHHDHNLRAAYLHVLADALTSLTAIFALLTGKYLGWGFMDPLMGVAGSVLVARWSWGLLRETSRVLLDHQERGPAPRDHRRPSRRSRAIASPISTCGASAPGCMRSSSRS